MKMVAMRDLKVGTFLAIQIVNHEEVALREVKSSLLQKRESTIAMFPEDYELWVLADVDAESGNVTVDRRMLCSLVSLSGDPVRAASPAPLRDGVQGRTA